jgi:dolichyl-phosphate-mannose-protein mannosyltransferase
VATDLETASDRDTASVEVTRPAAERRSRGPALVLGLVVVGGFAVYTLLALAVGAPRVHPDEVRYLIAASSLVEGEGLTLRGADYGFGPLVALVLAAILRLAGSVDEAYDWFKAANALFFALTAVPVYLLARRLVGAWWAVLAAALSVAIPSSISVATVMTESISYLAAAWALYAIAMALERPTALRQLAVLGAIAVAFLTRPQFGILYATWVGALALLWLIVPGSRPRTRRDLVGYWPTVLPLVLGVLAFAARLVTGTSARDSLGAYWELWRGYDPLQVGKWLVYHLGDFTVYLAVVPVAVAPIVLWELGRAGRAGTRRAGAFAALFASANATGLLVVAAFTSTPWGYDRLHDRYGFYLVPLWLVGLVVWLASGLPRRPVAAVAIGVVAALALPLVLPFRQLANEAGIDTVPGALWERVEAELAGPGPASGRGALLLVILMLLAATFLLPRRIARISLPVVVAISFAATSYFAWERLIEAPEDLVFAGGLERAWIDDRVPADTPVTKLYIDTACGSALERHALFLTEFFNSTVDRAAYIGDSVPDGLPIERVDVAASGLLERSGRPLVADYVFTQPGIELDGRRIAEGTAAGLVLWQVDGPVRVVGAASNEQLRRKLCA